MVMIVIPFSSKGGHHNGINSHAHSFIFRDF
jgi:hypothetical protein